MHTQKNGWKSSEVSFSEGDACCLLIFQFFWEQNCVNWLYVSGSSETDVHSHTRTLKDPSSESITSLMSVSGQSNCSSSPVSRRHSVTSKLCLTDPERLFCNGSIFPGTTDYIPPQILRSN
jgi:hypothetical protein